MCSVNSSTLYYCSTVNVYIPQSATKVPGTEGLLNGLFLKMFHVSVSYWGRVCGTTKLHHVCSGRNTVISTRYMKLRTSLSVGGHLLCRWLRCIFTLFLIGDIQWLVDRDNSEVYCDILCNKSKTFTKSLLAVCTTF